MSSFSFELDNVVFRSLVYAQTVTELKLFQVHI